VPAPNQGALRGVEGDFPSRNALTSGSVFKYSARIKFMARTPANPQLGLSLAKAKARWGGCREGAGRKASGKAKGLPHRPRPWHEAKHPVHVTLRVRRGLGSLRRYDLAATIVEAFRNAAHDRRRRETFRVIHFSIQPDHLHLIVEAGSKRSLGRGLQGLVSRLARRINRRRGRSGTVFADRYFGRPLSTPTEVRNAIVYVLTNAAKHAEPLPDRGTAPTSGLDPCSSAFWFDGWAKPPPAQAQAAPVCQPATWLLRTGWKRHGLLQRHERPAS
jgi:putative transposase